MLCDTALANVWCHLVNTCTSLLLVRNLLPGTMLLHRVCALWFSLALSTDLVIRQLAKVEAVQIISGYEQNYLFNGKPTKRNTVIITATERDSIGTLRIGQVSRLQLAISAETPESCS